MPVTTDPARPGPAEAGRRRQAFAAVIALEFWERFGFYGMQAILLLYLVQHLGVSEHDGNLMLGAFGMMVFVMPGIGGILGDRVLGTRRAVSAGAAIMALGYATMGASVGMPSLLFPGLALIATGNGFFKPNAGNLVRAIFDRDDAGLDAAFTLYYMAVNVGATVSMLLTPWLQIHEGSAVAFYASAIGLGIGLAYAAIRRRVLDIATNPVDRRPLRGVWLAGTIAGTVCVAAVAGLILSTPQLARLCVWLAALVLVAGWIALYRATPSAARPGLLLAYILCVQSALYYMFYQQMLTSLTLFALHAVDPTFRIGNMALFSLSAAQFETFNSIWIMVASPILALAYTRAARRGRDLALAVKVSIGFALVAIAFLVWWQAAARAPDDLPGQGAGLVSPWTMVLAYGFLSVGELLIGGLGLAVIARYAPARASGVMMGSLYLLWGLAMYVGSIVANEAARGGNGPGIQQAATTARTFVPLFFHLFVVATGIALVVAGLLPVCRRLATRHEAATDMRAGT